MSKSTKGPHRGWKPKRKPRFEDRWREKLMQAKADREVREDWLAAVHGAREDLELVASDTPEGHEAREAVLRADEVPEGVTHAMLQAAARRALEAM